MARRPDEPFKTIAQVLAILALAGLCGMVLHKGYSDFSALASTHRGEAFWPELLRYLLRNLAG